MIAKSRELTNSGYMGYRALSTRRYTEEEIQQTIESGSVERIREISHYFAETDGLYSQILLHYSTLLKYTGVLIPDWEKQKSEKKKKESYSRALQILHSLHLEATLPEIAFKVLTNGLYCGVIIQAASDQFTLMELPQNYCQSCYKDLNGLDLVEFNVSYFNSILKDEQRDLLLSTYPKEIKKAWNRYKAGKLLSPWILITSVPVIYFSFNEKGIPPFSNAILHCLKYEDAVETEREKELDEIRKIIVQKVPHLTDGRLLFEPDEAAEMHSAAVGMLKGNKNISVLTTYDDVEAIVSRTANDNSNATLEKMLNNVYSQTGVSGQLFSSTGSSTLESSIKNDISFMMLFANKIAWFLEVLLNEHLSKYTTRFHYQFLPVGIQNEDKYITTALKLATTGYSFLVPALAQGLGQGDLINLKTLENDTLKLTELLMPLSNSYTSSGDDNTQTNDVGRPKLDASQQSEKTAANQQSIDKQLNSGG